MQANRNRREDGRMLCAELVELSWTDDLGRMQRRIANLEDISLSGVCLQVENAIPVGVTMAVRYGDGELLGTVRYCRYEGMDYFVGVQLVDGCKWSSQHYQPEHLLDPSDLVDQAVERHRSSL